MEGEPLFGFLSASINSYCVVCVKCIKEAY